MNLIDLNEAVNLYASKRRKVMKHIGSIVQLVDNGIPYSDIAAILSSKAGIDCSIRYLQDIVYQYRKKSGKAPGSFTGEPLVVVPPAPQANQVAQAPKAPIQASQAVQSSGSPVKEVKAPVAAVEPAKEVKTTLEGKKAEEVKPAGESAGKFEFISPVSHLKKEGGCSAEEIIQEMREKDALKELRQAVALASIRKEVFTAEKASRIFQRPVTEEEIPVLLEKAAKQFREENADQIRKMEESAKRKAASKLF